MDSFKNINISRLSIKGDPIFFLLDYSIHVVDPAISYLNKTPMVPVEEKHVFKNPVDKRLEALLKILCPGVLCHAAHNCVYGTLSVPCFLF